jgi:hypothetical protein
MGRVYNKNKIVEAQIMSVQITVNYSQTLPDPKEINLVIVDDNDCVIFYKIDKNGNYNKILVRDPEDLLLDLLELIGFNVGVA